MERVIDMFMWNVEKREWNNERVDKRREGKSDI